MPTEPTRDQVEGWARSLQDSGGSSGGRAADPGSEPTLRDHLGRLTEQARRLSLAADGLEASVTGHRPPAVAPDRPVSGEELARTTSAESLKVWVAGLETAISRDVERLEALAKELG